MHIKAHVSHSQFLPLDDACAICNNKFQKLVEVPQQSRNTLFIHTGFPLRSVVQVTLLHTLQRRSIGCVTSMIRNTIFLSYSYVCHLRIGKIQHLAEINNFTWINFDNNSLGDESYKNLTGLTRSQFDVMMTNIDDIKHSKSRNIRSFIVILLVKLKYALKNKMLATLFNMNTWQVHSHFLL